MNPGPSYPLRLTRGGIALKPPQGQEDSRQSSIDDPAFSQGYRAAYATIYDRNDYAPLSSS